MKRRSLAFLLASCLALVFAAEVRATKEGEARPPAPGATAAGTAVVPPEAASNAEEAKLAAEVEFVRNLKYQKGKIEIGKSLAALDVPPAFGYLGPEDSKRILQIWGNLVDEVPLGMLFPAGSDPLADGSWAVVIQWSPDGYVKDDEASKIDYADLLKQMKDGATKENEERKKAGVATVDIIGWAVPPRYDAASHKLFWAQELKFSGNDENTLNYNIRMLGRRGVLVLNVVAGMSQLQEVEKGAPALLAMVDFKPGERYADFNPSSDKYAAYGLAALVAGGVATKAGFFKGILVAILAAKKFILIGLIAVGSFLAKLFRKKEA